jgi:hypothetical protein
VPRLCAAVGAAMGDDGSELWTSCCDGGAAVVRCHRARRMRGAARLLRWRRRLSAVIEYGGCEVQPGFCDGGAGCPLSSSTVGADVLSTEPGGAASGDSIGGGRRSYKRPAPLLQAPSGAATIARRRCYFPPAALLQLSGGPATIARRRCYFPPADNCPAALLQETGR